MISSRRFASSEPDGNTQNNAQNAEQGASFTASMGWVDLNSVSIPESPRTKVPLRIVDGSDI